jgi:hypothetical protein
MDDVLNRLLLSASEKRCRICAEMHKLRWNYKQTKRSLTDKIEQTNKSKQRDLMRYRIVGDRRHVAEAIAVSLQRVALIRDAV